jgi:hypothetical protein
LGAVSQEESLSVVGNNCAGSTFDGYPIKRNQSSPHLVKLAGNPITGFWLPNLHAAMGILVIVDFPLNILAQFFKVHRR